MFITLIVIIILIVAFFHMVQGFFSALLSAIFAVFAAVVAFSYHEVIVEKLLAGKIANYADAAMLMILFAVIYIIPRIIFDKTIPGNVRVQSTLDKVGALLCGLVAGTFVSGVVAVAAQEMPFDVGIGQYTRYPADDVKGVVPAVSGRAQDAVASDVLKNPVLDPKFRTPMFFPTDDFLVHLVAHLSDGGSLAGSQPLTDVHPDFLDELFGQRMGQEQGDTRVLQNKPGIDAVSVDGLFSLLSLEQKDADFDKPLKRNMDDLPQLKASPTKMLLVVRVMFHSAAAGEGSIVRISPGAVPLVAPQPDPANPGSMKWTDLYPSGTLDNPPNDPGPGGAAPNPNAPFPDEPLMWANRVDDFLFLDLGSGDRALDFVFLVNPSGLTNGVDQKTGQATIADNVFIEVKRMARVDLGGKAISPVYQYSKTVDVQRKPLVVHPPAPPTAAPTPPPPPPASTPPASTPPPAATPPTGGAPPGGTDTPPGLPTRVPIPPAPQ